MVPGQQQKSMSDTHWINCLLDVFHLFGLEAADMYEE